MCDIQKHISRFCKQSTCFMCGGIKWECKKPSYRLVSEEYDDDSWGYHLTTDKLCVIPATCNTCGNTILFDADKIANIKWWAEHEAENV